ncbi:hypothetical protein NFJ02_10g02990 [Pycnococcus provasolii]
MAALYISADVDQGLTSKRMRAFCEPPRVPMPRGFASLLVHRASYREQIPNQLMFHGLGIREHPSVDEIAEALECAHTSQVLAVCSLAIPICIAIRYTSLSHAHRRRNRVPRSSAVDHLFVCAGEADRTPHTGAGGIAGKPWHLNTKPGGIVYRIPRSRRMSPDKRGNVSILRSPSIRVVACESA